MLVWLWRIAWGFVLAQAVFFLGTLIATPGIELGTVIRRLQLWRELGVFFWQTAWGAPTLLLLIALLRENDLRISLAGVLLASAGVLAISLNELITLGEMLHPDGAGAHALRVMTLHRLAEALLALAALVLMRIAQRRRALCATRPIAPDHPL